MSKGQPTLFNLLFQLPWWISVLLACIAYISFVYIFPNIEFSNPYFNIFKNAFTHVGGLLSALLLLPAPFAYLNARRKRKLLDTQSDLNSIKELGWKAFEELVAEAYRRQGFRVVENGFGPDGGIDIKLLKDNAVTLVQCKQWRSRNVGVSVIREMFGVLTAERAEKVIIICCGGFTSDAKKFADDKPIELLGGDQLLALVRDVQVGCVMVTDSPTAAKSIDEENKTCPKCGHELIERIAKRGPQAGNLFFGCSTFPKCRYTSNSEG